MSTVIGVSAAGRIAVGLVEQQRLVSPIEFYPGPGDSGDSLDSGYEDVHSMPMEAFAETVAQLVDRVCVANCADPESVGIGFPGIIREGMIQESPNLKQAKGANLAELVTRALLGCGRQVRVSVYNDADTTAAGIAARIGQLERVIRVWTLGHGVGFGRYPHIEYPYEGGHTVVSLDPKEVFCGCGGKGHLEGILGHRAMRLRFLDLEPDEIFAYAAAGDKRCMDFEALWHRALAAATATSVHLEGPGSFFITGPSARFVRVEPLNQYLHEMVAMTALQGSVFELIPASDELGVIGAAVNAARKESRGFAFDY